MRALGFGCVLSTVLACGAVDGSGDATDDGSGGSGGTNDAGTDSGPGEDGDGGTGGTGGGGSSGDDGSSGGTDGSGGDACDLVGPWPDDTGPWPASRMPDGTPLGMGGQPSLSGDGRRTAFVSNIDPTDGMGSDFLFHVYVYDAQCDTTTRVPLVPDNPMTEELEPEISADGLTVVFVNRGQPVVDNLFTVDVFAYDLLTEEIEPVSVLPSGELAKVQSFMPGVNADGRIVAFWSSADLSPSGEVDGIFVRDRDAETTEWIGRGEWPRLSADGNVVAYALGEVSVTDRAAGTTDIISHNMMGNPTGRSTGASISRDGMIVAFASSGVGIADGDDNGFVDVYVHDRDTDAIERISVDENGDDLTTDAFGPQISGDGRYVLMSVGRIGATSTPAQLYVHDREADTLTLLSQTPAGDPLDTFIVSPAISGDGSWAAFETQAPNLIDPPEMLSSWDAWVVGL